MGMRLFVLLFSLRQFESGIATDVGGDESALFQFYRGFEGGTGEDKVTESHHRPLSAPAPSASLASSESKLADADDAAAFLRASDELPEELDSDDEEELATPEEALVAKTTSSKRQHHKSFKTKETTRQIAPDTKSELQKAHKVKHTKKNWASAPEEPPEEAVPNPDRVTNAERNNHDKVLLENTKPAKVENEVEHDEAVLEKTTHATDERKIEVPSATQIQAEDAKLEKANAKRMSRFAKAENAVAKRMSRYNAMMRNISVEPPITTIVGVVAAPALEAQAPQWWEKLPPAAPVLPTASASQKEVAVDPAIKDALRRQEQATQAAQAELAKWKRGREAIAAKASPAPAPAPRVAVALYTGSPTPAPTPAPTSFPQIPPAKTYVPKHSAIPKKQGVVAPDGKTAGTPHRMIKRPQAKKAFLKPFRRLRRLRQALKRRRARRAAAAAAAERDNDHNLQESASPPARSLRQVLKRRRSRRAAAAAAKHDNAPNSLELTKPPAPLSVRLDAGWRALDANWQTAGLSDDA